MFRRNKTKINTLANHKDTENPPKQVRGSDDGFWSDLRLSKKLARVFEYSCVA